VSIRELVNARAALDHAVFPHIRAKKPQLEGKLIQYPIEDYKAQWENKKKWFNSPAAKVVGRSQPHRKGAEFAGHPLRVLRELVNQDKHRDLVIANYVMAIVNVGQRDLYTVVSTSIHKVPMKAGAVVAEAHRRLAQSLSGERLEQIPSEVGYAECIEVAYHEPVGLWSRL
jgi:hypothetical protein